jgi:hypothetical protein
LLFRESVVIHANLTKLRETFLKAQILKRAILEGSGREELPEVVFFTEKEAEELSSCLNLLYFSRLYIIVDLVGLWRAELTLEVDLRMGINEVFDRDCSQEVYGDAEAIRRSMSSGGVPNDDRSASITFSAGLRKTRLVEKCVENGRFAYAFRCAHIVLVDVPYCYK